jgi:hypothetical protein
MAFPEYEMGHHIVVSKHAGSGELKIERIEASIESAAKQGLFPGFDRGLFWEIVYVEFTPDRGHAERRSRWLESAAGRRALETALEADARGECRCQELLFGAPMSDAN